MTEEKANETSELEQVNQVPVTDPFSDESWAEQPVKSEVPAQTEQLKTDGQPEVKKEETTAEPFYKKLGFEKEDDVVTEITTLREKASKVAEEKPFANEQSKQVHELLREGKTKEVREFLQNQEQIDELVSLQVDKENAAEIIKLQMKLKNKQLSAKEIEFEYKQNFELPKEPVQKVTEDDDDFNERVQEWKEKCEIVETKRVIAAKLAQPELTNLKSELVLPEISKREAQQSTEPTPEDLAAFEKDKTSFLQTSETFLNGFNGFTQQVKDKDVDYTVSYTPSQEEKTFITGKLSEFAESGFDANTLLAERWVSEDRKTMKIDQMVKDLSWLYGQDKVSQKLATDSANKRIDAYLKEKKQINVNEVNQNGSLQMNKDNKNEQVQLQEFFWNQD